MKFLLRPSYQILSKERQHLSNVGLLDPIATLEVLQRLEVAVPAYWNRQNQGFPRSGGQRYQSQV